MVRFIAKMIIQVNLDTYKCLERFSQFPAFLQIVNCFYISIRGRCHCILSMGDMVLFWDYLATFSSMQLLTFWETFFIFQNILVIWMFCRLAVSKIENRCFE